MSAPGYCYFCLFLLVSHCQSRQNFEDNYRPSDVLTEVMKVRNSTPIKLRCHYHTKVKWEFKPCETNYFRSVCDNNEKWKDVNESGKTMHINAATKQNNGIYRCLHNRKVLKMFLVEVKYSHLTGKPPYVASLKTFNVTGPMNMKVMIQCNVTSIMPPTIVWGKNCYGHKCDLRYNETCYCRMSTTSSSSNGDDTYISKYHIFNARNVDSGTYTCFAINEFGSDEQNVTIVVPAPPEHIESSSLLFMIPLVLILLLMAICLCYHKKKKVVRINQHNRLLRPVVRITEET